MKQLLLICMVLSATVATTAQQDLFEKKEFIYRGDTLRYRVLFPQNYDRTQKYPLVLFLHGAGERGNDNESQLKHGSFLFTDKQNQKDYPAIVLFPQCPAEGYWAPMERSDEGRFFPPRPQATAPMQLVEQLVKQYKRQESVDKKRMYILGISMGGMGTFDYICRHPKQFACAVPICGGVNPERLKKVRRMPIRIYHGGADPVVAVEFSRDAYIELKADGSERVEYIEYPGVGHDSWNNAFAEPDLLKWMFGQSRR